MHARASSLTIWSSVVGIALNQKLDLNYLQILNTHSPQANAFFEREERTKIRILTAIRQIVMRQPCSFLQLLIFTIICICAPEHAHPTRVGRLCLLHYMDVVTSVGLA